MDWNIPQISGQPLQITLEVGEKLFIVGANGSGKIGISVSNLLHRSSERKLDVFPAYRQDISDV